MTDLSKKPLSICQTGRRAQYKDLRAALQTLLLLMGLKLRLLFLMDKLCWTTAPQSQVKEIPVHPPYLTTIQRLEGTIHSSNRLFPEPIEHKWTIRSCLVIFILPKPQPRGPEETLLPRDKPLSTSLSWPGQLKHSHMDKLKPLSERGKPPRKGNCTARTKKGEGNWEQPSYCTTSVSS